MARLVKALERRTHSRVRRQLPCKLLFDGRCHGGIVRDFSDRGLFVQIGDELPAGADVVIAFSAPEGPRFVLEASAPRRSPVPRSLLRLSPLGVGLRILAPPPAYLRWVQGGADEMG